MIKAPMRDPFTSSLERRRRRGRNRRNSTHLTHPRLRWVTLALVFLCTGTPHSLGLTLIAQKERDRGQSTYSRDRLIWMELLVLGLNRRRFTRPLR